MKKYTPYIVIALFIISLVITLCFIPIGVSKMIPRIENQISDELGIKVHIEKLILRGGPYLKLKSPTIHLLYDNGQKFGQFNNIKFYISWFSILKHKPEVCKIYANKLELRLNSDDKQLADIINRMQSREFHKTPDIYYKDYKFTYNDKAGQNIYRLEGSGLSLSKIPNFQNWRVKTDGNFYINDKKFLNLSLDIKNKYDMQENQLKPDIKQFINQLILLDFHADTISDITVYKNKDNVFQASGFVNIDNMSILDKEKKCPKSFIYVTLWGNKASLLSHIYTAENKKVYLDGLINNNGKTSVDLKVKTDDIELNDLYKKLKVLSSFTRLKDLSSLSGKLEANFALKGDLSKIKSNGYLKISDANFEANGIQVEQINSDIDLSNNKIYIKNATGMVKKALITATGTIDKNIDVKLNMAGVPIKHLCPKNFGIKDGVVSLSAVMTGNADNIIHKEKVQIDNLRFEKNNHKVSVTSLSIDTNKNNTAYIRNLLYTTPYFNVIKIPSSNLKIEKDTISISQTKAYMPNSQFEIKGKISDYSNKNLAFDTTVNGKLYSKDIKSLNNISDTFPIKISVNGNKDVQNIVLKLLIEKASVFSEPSIVNAVLKKENNNIKIDEISLSDYTGRFSDDYKAIKNKRIIINGLVENIEKPILKNVRIFIPQTININLCDTFAQIKGDVFVNGSLMKPEIVGQLSVSNLFNQLTQMTVLNSVFDFNKNLVVFNIPTFKVSDFAVSMTGTAYTDNIFKELNIKLLNIKSKYVNADTFLMYKDIMRVKDYPVTVNEAKFYIEKLHTTVYTSPLALSAVSGDFKLQNNVLYMRNISAEAFNGKVAGKIDYNLREDMYLASIMSRNISAAPIFSIVSDKSDTISGVMDFDAQMSGSLTSKNCISGNIKFIVRNGRMSSLGKLEHLLYAQNVVADSMLRTSLNTITRAVSLKDTGLFKYLRGNVVIKNGVADVHYIQSQGPLMSLFIKGTYNLNDNNAKLSILGRLSDEVTNSLGAFGEFSFDKLKIMITGEENKYKALVKDLEMLPQLQARNTKEFYSLINGNVNKSSSVMLFNWISYTEKSLRQKDVPMTNITVPSFVDELPY